MQNAVIVPKISTATPTSVTLSKATYRLVSGVIAVRDLLELTSTRLPRVRDVQTGRGKGCE